VVAELSKVGIGILPHDFSGAHQNAGCMACCRYGTMRQNSLLNGEMALTIWENS